jgi:hypothetical protein
MRVGRMGRLQPHPAGDQERNGEGYDSAGTRHVALVGSSTRLR